MEDLNNLQEWQAVSHSDLAQRKPGDLFQPEFAERYSRLHNDLWQRIVRLHGTIHTLEELAEFPFDYVYGQSGMEFWRLVRYNFIEYSVVLLHGLVNDQSSDAHTIPNFKNEIFRARWLDQEMRVLLKQTLKERKFDQHAKSVAGRVQKIRHKLLAHRLIDRKTGYLKEPLDGITLQDLRDLFNAAHSLFGALSFGSAYCTLAGDLTPGTVGGKPTRTCLARVLDAVIRDCGVANKPERRGKWWPMDREFMKPEDIQIMNDLRKRVGLPEA